MKAKIEALSPLGFIVQFETPDLNGRADLLESLTKFQAELSAAGWQPTTPAALPQPAQPGPAQNGHADLPCFLVDSITATVAEGKVSWRVKGGEFQKWGVVIYPEVLERAGLGELNPLKTFSEPGLVAYYSLKDDGKPKKVIRLERVG